MKNYYDELEVSKNASQEVITKAYKVLAKKYHPDMVEESHKQEAEEKFKKISEAYETLSNKTSRDSYDEELKRLQPEVNVDDYQRLVKNNQLLQQELQQLKAKLSSLNQSTNTHTSSTTPQYQTPPSAQYRKVVYTPPQPSYRKPTFFERLKFKAHNLFKNALAVLLTIAFIFILFFILLHIPYTKKLLLNDMGFSLFFNIFQ